MTRHATAEDGSTNGGPGRYASVQNSKSSQRNLMRGRIAGADFLQLKVNLTPASHEQCSRLQQSRWCRYWFFCCVHRSCDSQCFSMGLTTPKNAPSLGGPGPHLIHGSLGPRKSPQNGISIGSVAFAGLTNVTNRKTHTQTDHATASVAIDRI